MLVPKGLGKVHTVTLIQTEDVTRLKDTTHRWLAELKSSAGWLDAFHAELSPQRPPVGNKIREEVCGVGGG